MKRVENRQKVLDAIKEMYGDISQITRQQLQTVAEQYNLVYPQWITHNQVARGIYAIPKHVEMPKEVKEKIVETQIEQTKEPVVEMAPVSNTNIHTQFIPTVMQGYVQYGYYKDLNAIIDSKQFFPVYITGLSGNGKTLMVSQICAKQKRELIRANITAETDEDSLLGGFRLYKGETVWEDGPVVLAMKRGAILLLDEVDLGTNKLLCLQPVLEGNSIYVKRINQVIHPAPGFNIIATANTKGQGSETGKFIGTNTLNEAFLERFTVTFEQDYPTQKVEVQILQKLPIYNEEMQEFVELLTNWAAIVREAYNNNAITEIISTRRLVHIMNTYSVLKNKKKAIEMCMNRFDTETQQALLDLYKKVDKALDDKNEAPATATSQPDDNSFTDNVPF